MEESFVDAILEGKIVRVPEVYAKREGLMIIGRPKKLINDVGSYSKSKSVEEKRSGMEDLRKPLKWTENHVVKELVPNFHWEIGQRRRQRNIGRRQLADAIGEREDVIRMVENGILPKDDFVLINKIQNYLQLNLRRDKVDFSQAMRNKVDLRNYKERINERKMKEKEEFTQSKVDFEGFKGKEMVGKDIELEEAEQI